MGFWEKLERLAEIADDALTDAQAVFDKELERCQGWDDDVLIREWSRTTRILARAAYWKELQNRGYSAEDFE